MTATTLARLGTFISKTLDPGFTDTEVLEAIGDTGATIQKLLDILCPIPLIDIFSGYYLAIVLRKLHDEGKIKYGDINFETGESEIIRV